MKEKDLPKFCEECGAKVICKFEDKYRYDISTGKKIFHGKFAHIKCSSWFCIFGGEYFKYIDEE